jgi:hypothetical protein
MDNEKVVDNFNGRFSVERGDTTLLESDGPNIHTYSLSIHKAINLDYCDSEREYIQEIGRSLFRFHQVNNVLHDEDRILVRSDDEYAIFVVGHENEYGEDVPSFHVHCIESSFDGPLYN